MGKCKYYLTDFKRLKDMGIDINTKGKPACLLLAQNLKPIISCPYRGNKENCELLKELNLVQLFS